MTGHTEIRVVATSRKPRLKRRFVHALQHDHWQTVTDIARGSNNKVGRVRMWLRMLVQAHLIDVHHAHTMYGIDQRSYRLSPGSNVDQCLEVLL